MKAELREASADQLPVFIDMDRQPETAAFILPYSLEQHQLSFADERTIYLSIYEFDELCGYFILLLEADEISVEFRRIVVARQNRNIGQQAITLMEEYCRDRLVRRRVWLDVFESNHRGRHIYTKFGYREFDRRPQDDGRVLILMEKRLA